MRHSTKVPSSQRPGLRRPRERLPGKRDKHRVGDKPLYTCWGGFLSHLQRKSENLEGQI